MISLSNLGGSSGAYTAGWTGPYSMNVTSTYCGAASGGLLSITGLSNKVAVKLGGGVPGPKYPPVDFTSNSTNVSGQAYGNGTYTITRSSVFAGSPTYESYHGFDSNAGWWACGASSYNTSTGAYASSTTTAISGSNYKGEWIALQLPQAIQLSAYRVFPPPSSTVGTNPSPSTWVLGGSTNNTTWTSLHVQSNPLNWTGTPTSLLYTVSPGAAYSSYRMVITSDQKQDWSGVDRLQFLT
jgi:hypothetical protein